MADGSWHNKGKNHKVYRLALFVGIFEGRRFVLWLGVGLAVITFVIRIDVSMSTTLRSLYRQHDQLRYLHKDSDEL